MWHSLTLLFVHCVNLSNKNPKLHFVILTVTFKHFIRRITLFGISFSNQQKQLPPFHPVKRKKELCTSTLWYFDKFSSNNSLIKYSIYNIDGFVTMMSKQ